MTDVRPCDGCGGPGGRYVVRWSEALPAARMLQRRSGTLMFFASGGGVAEVSLGDEQDVTVWDQLLLCLRCYTSKPLEELAASARARHEASGDIPGAVE